MNNQLLENKIHVIHTKFNKIINELTERPEGSNLSRNENNILKNLKEKLSE